MKFDFAIGNPPYQDNAIGENDTYAPPVYNKFLDAAYAVADSVEMIHPARFLFNAGSTPKAWNEKMLNDPHFKVMHYEEDASKVFANTDIKGGVAITYRTSDAKYEPIVVFTKYPALNHILHKVNNTIDFVPMDTLVVTRTAYRLTEKLHQEHTEAMDQLSKGHVLKITQHLTPDVWKYVPRQDFTDKSDIDWSVSIANIDKQLYKKYGLSEEEIAFIETNVKEME